MQRISFRRPSASLVISVMALFVALGGGAYALTIPVNSVGNAQIKQKAVSTAKIRDQAISVSRIKDGAVSSIKLAGGAVGSAALADGQVGAADLGPGAVISSKLGVITLRQATVTVPANTANNSAWNSRAVEIDCAAGEKAISVGTVWNSDANDEELITVYARLKVVGGVPTGARARGATDINAARQFTVQATCLQAG